MIQSLAMQPVGFLPTLLLSSDSTWNRHYVSNYILVIDLSKKINKLST